MLSTFRGMAPPKICALLTMTGLLVALLAPRAAATEIDITESGPPEVVFRWKRDACEPIDYPDAPARAFRDAAGQVHLLATHFVNRALVGPELHQLAHACAVIFRGQESPRPQDWSDRAWLASPYTLDGKTVVALVHDEFQGHRHPGLCPTGKYMDCWYNAVTLAISRDGGRSFAQGDDKLVAALPYTFEASRGRHSGFFNPSNIVHNGGYYFTILFSETRGAQKRGSCLIRTDRLEQPGTWRGWDGSDFTVAFANPYEIVPDQADRHVCTPVGVGQLRWPVTSLVRHEPSGLFIALMMGANVAADGTTKESGVWVASSTDLITWSAPRFVLPGIALGKHSCDGPAPIAYPSLIDRDSTSRNFETVGATADIYATRFNLADCKPVQDRDLIRIPVHLSVRP